MHKFKIILPPLADSTEIGLEFSRIRFRAPALIAATLGECWQLAKVMRPLQFFMVNSICGFLLRECTAISNHDIGPNFLPSHKCKTDTSSYTEKIQSWLQDSTVF